VAWTVAYVYYTTTAAGTRCCSNAWSRRPPDRARGSPAAVLQRHWLRGAHVRLHLQVEDPDGCPPWSRRCGRPWPSSSPAPLAREAGRADCGPRTSFWPTSSSAPGRCSRWSRTTASGSAPTRSTPTSTAAPRAWRWPGASVREQPCWSAGWRRGANDPFQPGGRRAGPAGAAGQVPARYRGHRQLVSQLPLALAGIPQHVRPGRPAAGRVRRSLSGAGAAVRAVAAAYLRPDPSSRRRRRRAVGAWLDVVYPTSARRRERCDPPPRGLGRGPPASAHPGLGSARPSAVPPGRQAGTRWPSSTPEPRLPGPSVLVSLVYHGLLQLGSARREYLACHMVANAIDDPDRRVVAGESSPRVSPCVRSTPARLPPVTGRLAVLAGRGARLRRGPRLVAARAGPLLERLTANGSARRWWFLVKHGRASPRPAATAPGGRGGPATAPSRRAGGPQERAVCSAGALFRTSRRPCSSGARLVSNGARPHAPRTASPPPGGWPGMDHTREAVG